MTTNLYFRVISPVEKTACCKALKFAFERLDRDIGKLTMSDLPMLRGMLAGLSDKEAQSDLLMIIGNLAQGKEIEIWTGE